MRNFRILLGKTLVIGGVAALSFLSLSSSAISPTFQVPQVLAQGTTNVYVAPTGNDSNNGQSTSTPVRTIDRAVTLAANGGGGTVFVMGGTYSNTDESINHGNSSNPAIVIRPYQQQVSTFEGVAGSNESLWTISSPNITVEGSEMMVFDGTGVFTYPVPSGEGPKSIIQINTGNTTVSGLEIRNSRNRGISYYQSDNVTIRDNIVHDIYMRAIGGSGNNILIEDNTVFNAVLENQNQAMCGGGWAAAVSTVNPDSGNPNTTEYNSNITFRNNRIYDNWGEGLIPFDSRDVKIIGNQIYNNYSVNMYVDTTQEIVIDGNYIYQTPGYRPRSCDAGRETRNMHLANETRSLTASLQNIVISNNIIAGGHSGISFWHDGSNTNPNNTYLNTVIAHNIIKNSANRAVDFEAVPSGFTPPSNVHFINNIVHAGGSGTFRIQGNHSAWTVSHNHWADGVPTDTSAITPTNNTVGNPLYQAADPGVGAPATNFQIQQMSPAARSGRSTSMIPVQYWSPANYIARDYFGNTFSASNPSRGIHEQTSVLPNPDLVISDIDIIGSLEQGGQVSIVVTVQNTGTGSVSAPLDLFLNPATQPPTTASTPTQTQTVNLGAGASQIITFTVTLTQAGNNTLYAWIDRGDAVVESNETNNLFGPVNFTVTSGCTGSIADFDCDGDVDIVDYTFLTARFYKTTADDLRADIASRQGVGIPDGRVDLFDYTVLVDEFSL